MRLARFEADGSVHEGVVRDGDIETDDEVFDLEAVELLPPCEPTKVVAAGKNYVDHVAEMSGGDMPSFPFLFFKPASSVIGPDDEIVYPEGLERVHYEGELGLVIGARCRDVPVEDAMDYVLGYTCVNDVSARDWSDRENQWFRHKGMDTFCPVGPYVQTAFPEFVDVETRVNGEVKQSANTADMGFSGPELVAEAAAYVTLEPGDVVATGTPSGVGNLNPGDEVEVEVESVGTLRNEVVAEDDA